MEFVERLAAIVRPHHGVLRRHIQPKPLPRFPKEAAQLLAEPDGQAM